MKYYKPDKNRKIQENGENNPFDSFHDNYFKLTKSIRNWQIAFFSMFIICLLSLAMTFKLATQSSIIPYIVEVNKETGIVKGVDFINKIRYTTNDKLIISALRKHINETRLIPLDSVVYSKNIDEAYNFLSVPMQRKLLENIRIEDTEGKMKDEETRDIKIKSILKQSDNTYQIRWNEKVYDKDGNILSSTPVTGLFTIKLIEPKTEEQMLINPLGIIITNFNYSNDVS